MSSKSVAFALMVLFGVMASSFALNVNVSEEQLYPSWIIVSEVLYHVSPRYENGTYITCFEKVNSLQPYYHEDACVNGFILPFAVSGSKVIGYDWLSSKFASVDLSSFPNLTSTTSSQTIPGPSLPAYSAELPDGKFLVVEYPFGDSPYYLIITDNNANIYSITETIKPSEGEFDLRVDGNTIYQPIRFYSSLGVSEVRIYQYNGTHLNLVSSYQTNFSQFPGGYSDFRNSYVGYKNWVIYIAQNENRDATSIITFDLSNNSVIDIYETNLTYAYSFQGASLVYNQYDDKIYVLIPINTRLLVAKLSTNGTFEDVQWYSLYGAFSHIPVSVPFNAYNHWYIIPVKISDGGISWIIYAPTTDKFTSDSFVDWQDGSGTIHTTRLYYSEVILVEYNGTDVKYQHLTERTTKSEWIGTGTVLPWISVYDKYLLLPIIYNSPIYTRNTLMIYIDELGNFSDSFWNIESTIERTYNITISNITTVTGNLQNAERLLHGNSGDITVQYGYCDATPATGGPILTDKVTNYTFYWIFIDRYLQTSPYEIATDVSPSNLTWNDTYHGEITTAYIVNYTGPASWYDLVAFVCGSSDCRMESLYSGAQYCVAEPLMKAPVNTTIVVSTLPADVVIDVGITEVGYTDYLTSFSADVYVDGNLIGSVSPGNTLITLSLDAGTHTIQVIPTSVPYLYYKSNSKNFTIEISAGQIDTMPPVVSIVSPSPGTIVGGDFNISFAAYDDSGLSRCWYETTDGQSGDVACDAGILTISPQVSGWYTVTIYAEDTYGNIGNASIEVGVDRFAPVIYIYSPVEGEVYHTSVVTLDYFISDDFGLTEIGGKLYGITHVCCDENCTNETCVNETLLENYTLTPSEEKTIDFSYWSRYYHDFKIQLYAEDYMNRVTEKNVTFKVIPTPNYGGGFIGGGGFITGHATVKLTIDTGTTAYVKILRPSKSGRVQHVVISTTVEPGESITLRPGKYRVIVEYNGNVIDKTITIHKDTTLSLTENSQTASAIKEKVRKKGMSSAFKSALNSLTQADTKTKVGVLTVLSVLFYLLLGL